MSFFIVLPSIIAASVQWQSPHLFWLTALALAAALSGIVWLYRPQVRPLRAPWWWVLLGLRTLALGVLAVSILRPTVLRAVKVEQRPMAAVLVDQSASMGVVDAGRTPAQLVQLAAAIGEMPSSQRPTALAELRARCLELRQTLDELSRATSELEYARLAGRGVESAEAQVRATRKAFAERVAALGALAAAGSAPGTSGLTELLAPLVPDPSQPRGDLLDRPDAAVERIEQVVGRIDELQLAADEQLYQNDPAVRQACDRLASMPRVELVKRALLSESGGGGLVARIGADRPLRFFGFTQNLGVLQLPLDELWAEGPRTDLAGALREARRRLAGQRVACAIVFTDGRQTGPDADRPFAPESPPLWPEVPVFAVVTAPPSTRDLAVSRVSLPSSGFVGETIPVRVEISAAGFDGTVADVSLDTGRDAQRKRRGSAQVTISGGAARVELPLALDSPGLLELTVTLASQRGEATDRNNTVHRTIKVFSEKVRVALIGGAATRDYQHLRAALLRSPRFAVLDRLADTARPADLRPEQILEQDALVLCDLPADALNASQWGAIDRLVNAQGGSALLIVSEPSVAATYGSQPLTSSLLPWRGGAQPSWRVWPGEEPMFRVVPATVDLHELIKLSDDPEVSRARWNQLPGIYRFLSMPPLRSGARALLIEGDSGSPVLTEMPSGTGRVLLLGSGEVWRWRGVTGTGSDSPQRELDRFWLQLVRYAAQQPYTAHDGNLWLDVERTQVEPGESVRVRARVRTGGGDVEADPPVVTPILQLLRAGGEVVKTEQLTAPVPGFADRYETVLPELPAGDYELRLIAGEQPLTLPLRVVETDEAELRDVSPDLATLQQLVGPRGAALDMNQLQSLPQRIAEATRAEPAYTELRLWDSPYLFLLVVGCLGIEWAVRKRVGLA